MNKDCTNAARSQGLWGKRNDGLSSDLENGLGLLSLSKFAVTVALLGCTPPAVPAQTVEVRGQDSEKMEQLTPEHQAMPVALNAGTCPAEPLLDDMQDNNAQIHVADGRDGYWYSFQDDKGSQVLPASGAPFLMHSLAAPEEGIVAKFSGRTGPGESWMGVGFDFSSKKAAYDISCCRAIRFRAKRGADSSSGVRVKLGGAQTLPAGGICNSCYNDFGADLLLTEDWKTYTLAFEQLTQQSWGDRFEQLMTSAVYQLQWQVSHPRRQYEIYLDDVTLVGCGGEEL